MSLYLLTRLLVETLLPFLSSFISLVMVVFTFSLFLPHTQQMDKTRETPGQGEVITSCFSQLLSQLCGNG